MDMPLLLEIKSLLRPLLLVGLAIWGVACSDSSIQFVACTSDADCRDGYMCDLNVYVGECIQSQQVIRITC